MHEVESERIDVAITSAQEAKQTVDAFGLHSLGAEGPEPKTRHGRIYLLRVGIAGIVNNHPRGQGNVVGPAAKYEHRVRLEIGILEQVFFQYLGGRHAKRLGRQSKNVRDIFAAQRRKGITELAGASGELDLVQDTVDHL